MNYKNTYIFNNHSLLQFWKYFFTSYPIKASILLFASGAIVMEANIMPYAIKMLIDDLIANSSDRSNIITKIVPAVALFFGSHIIFLIIIRAAKHIESNIIPSFEQRLYTAIFYQVIRLPYRHFAQLAHTNIANKLLELPQALEQLRTIISWNILPSIIVVIATTIMTLNIHYYFSLIIISWVILHVGVSLYVTKKLNNLAQQHAQHRWKFSGQVFDVCANILNVRAFSRYEFEEDYFRNNQHKVHISNRHLIRYTNLVQICLDVPLLLMIACIVYNVLLLWQTKDITTGQGIFVINSSFAVMYQLWSISQVLTNLSRQFGICKQALEVLFPQNIMQDSDTQLHLQITKGEVEFNNVCFTYPNGKKVFENLSLKIPARQKVGIVGLSGSGKSSLLKILLRLHEIDSGTITIDRYDITSHSTESLNSHIAFVPSEIVLFKRSIIDNIKYGKIEASDHEVIDAAKAACIDEYIQALPDGYESVIGIDNFQCSSGQQQRILLARAYLENAPIILLDEPTSALDGMTESLINKSFKELIKDKTVLVTAHRLSTLSTMDRIIIFENGKIIEDGTHQELMRRDSYYKTLFCI